MDVFRKVLRLCKKNTKRLLLVALGLGIISSATSVLSNVLFGQLAERVVNLRSGDATTLVPVLTVLAIILGVYLAISPLAYFLERNADKFRFTALTELRIKGYEKLQRLPIAYFSNNRPGSIVQKSLYVNQVVNWLADFVESRIYNIAIPLFSLVPLFSYSWIIGLMTMVGILVTVFIQSKKTVLRRPYITAGNEAWDEAVGVYNEHVSHMSTSRTSAHQPSIKKLFVDALNFQLGFRKKQLKVEQNYNALQLVAEAIIITSILLVTVYLAYKDQIGVAALVAILAMIRNIMMNSRSASGIYDSYIQATADGQRFVNLIEEPEETMDQNASKQLQSVESLEFRAVGFRYTDGKKDALENISFRIEKNQSVAIVGESGGGKSTLSSLLMRLYEPTTGDVLINGESAGVYYSESVRQAIGMVMQDVALYHVSVADNIRLAKPAASDKEIREALKLANAWEFVNALPNGIDTVVGERGVKLSGGQRQRIAIARAAVKRPSLIILDEATSALDSKAEHEVQLGLEKLLKGTKAVIIAHRLSTIAHADKIIVLDKGKVVEDGTFEELKKRDGVFADLLAHQQL